MSVILSAETERLIEERMKRDGYASADDAVRAALELLDAQDQLDPQDLAAIEESERQIAAGEELDWKQVSAELRRQYLSE